MSSSVEVKIYPNPKKVVKRLAKLLSEMISATSQHRFDIALSGGKTPGLLFEVIAEKYAGILPWDRIHLWWGDERCVPPGSSESNFKLAYDTFISKIGIPENNVHRIFGEENPEGEAVRYSAEISRQLNMRGQWPVFDLIILGLGDDGHTASIFPYQTELMDAGTICAVSEHPLTGQKRITLTGKVLNNANRVFFLATGEKKALRISEIMNDDEAAKLLPAYYIAPENGELIWFIDEAAAALIA